MHALYTDMHLMKKYAIVYKSSHRQLLKGIGMGVLQYNFIYKNRQWGRFDVWVTVC